MTDKNQKLDAIKTSLLKIAQDIGQPAVAAPGQVAAPTEGSPEQVMELIDDAIEVLEVAQEQVPAEKPGQVAAPAITAKSKTKSAQDEDDDDDDDDDDKAKEAKQRKAQEDEKKGEKENKQPDDDDDGEKTAALRKRIAALEDEKEEREKEKVAQEFAQLYPEDVREAKFDELIKGDVKAETLTAQLKVAQDVHDANKPKGAYVPATSQSAFLTRKASLVKQVPAWRT